MNWAGNTELGVGELVHGDNFSLFEAMSAVEVSSPQLIMFLDVFCSTYVILVVDLFVIREMWGCYHSIFVSLMTYERSIYTLTFLLLVLDYGPKDGCRDGCSRI